MLHKDLASCQPPAITVTKRQVLRYRRGRKSHQTSLERAFAAHCEWMGVPREEYGRVAQCEDAPVYYALPINLKAVPKAPPPASLPSLVVAPPIVDLPEPVIEEPAPKPKKKVKFKKKVFGKKK